MKPTHEELLEELSRILSDYDILIDYEVPDIEESLKAKLMEFIVSKLDTYADAKYKEGYEKGQEDAFNDRIENMSSLTVIEHIPKHIFDSYADAKLAEVAEEIEKKNTPYLSQDEDSRMNRVGYRQALSDSASIIRSKMSKKV